MSKLRSWLTVLGLCGGIFGADLFTPSGVATGMLYAPAIPIAARSLGRRPTVWVAVLCAVLNVAGAWLSPSGGELWMAFVNRGFVMVLIAAATVLTLERTRIAGSLQHEQRSLEDFKYALDQSAIVAATDARGRITYANDRFCGISKYAREELLGQDHRIINSGYHPKEFIRELWDTIRSGRVWRGEMRNRAKDGSFYWVDTTIVPFLDEDRKPYQYLAIRADITERKRAEQRLVEQGALVRLGQMAAVVAHEVKNPLAGIAGAVQVIGGRLPPESTDRQIVQEILARIAALDSSVKDLLLFARPRLPQLTSVSLSALLLDTVALLRRDPQAQGVTIDLPHDDAVVSGDPDQLRPVLLNILLNAAQAMQGRGEVRVAFTRCDGQCLVSVRDTGPGIPAEVRDHVFEPFYTTKHRGTGLGLAIAKRVIELHGGTIAAISPPGAGTTIEISLPLKTG